jgi:CRISPR-associated protein Csb2
MALSPICGGGRWVNEPSEEKDAAFRWLECLDPPHIVAPPARNGARVALYVPNNDLDAYGGDPQRIGDIRLKKHLVPRLFDHKSSVVYAWPFNEGGEWVANISVLVGRMHTLGLALDAAHARAETVSWDQAEARLPEHSGRVVRPGGDAARGATCPTEGSLESKHPLYLSIIHISGEAKLKTYLDVC